MFLHKQMLSVGDYFDGPDSISITSDRLKNWQANHEKMTANGLVIPVRWDHTNHVTPMSLEEFERPDTKDTVGKLAGFKVMPDAQSAEVVLEFRDEAAYNKAKQNVVRLSPIILDSFEDGKKNKYGDSITHMDLVNYPIDHKQGDFKDGRPTAIAMSLRVGAGTKIFKMSSEEDDGPPKKDGDGDGKTGESDPPKKDGEGDDTPDAGGDGDMQGLITNLAKMKIVLPQDTTSSNLIDRLNVAVMTAMAHDDSIAPGGPAGAPAPAGGAGAGVAQPPVMMSNEAKAFEKVWKDNLSRRIAAAVETGRATPAEGEAWENDLKATKMSLNSAGDTIERVKLDYVIEAREGLPAGTYWDAATKTQKMGLGIAVPNREVTGRDLTDEEADALARKILRKPAK